MSNTSDYHRFGPKWNTDQLAFFIAVVSKEPTISSYDMLKRLGSAYENPSYSSPTTIGQQMKIAKRVISKQLVEPDDSDDAKEEWTFRNELDPEDARLIINALADVLVELGGQKKSFTLLEAEQVVKVQRAAPALGGWEAYKIARAYIERGDANTLDLDMLLALAGRHDGITDEMFNRFQYQLANRLIPNPPPHLYLKQRVDLDAVITTAIEQIPDDDPNKPEVLEQLGKIKEAMDSGDYTVNLQRENVDASDNVPAHDIP